MEQVSWKEFELVRVYISLHLAALSLFLGGWVLVVSGKIKSVESLIKCITFNQQQRRSKVYRQKFWQFHCPPELAWVGCRVIEYVWCSHWELKLLSKILSCFLLRDTNTNFHHLRTFSLSPSEEQEETSTIFWHLHDLFTNDLTFLVLFLSFDVPTHQKEQRRELNKEKWEDSQSTLNENVINGFHHQQGKCIMFGAAKRAFISLSSAAGSGLVVPGRERCSEGKLEFLHRAKEREWELSKWKAVINEVT